MSNRIRVLFLDDGVCEKLARHLWPNNADQVIRDKLVRERKSRLLNAVLLERDANPYRPTSRRVRLLKLSSQLRKGAGELGKALEGPDHGLTGTCGAVVDQISRPHPPALSELAWKHREEPRKRAEHMLQFVAKWRVRVRQELADMRKKLNAARQEISKLSPDDVAVTFRTERARFSEANGSDIRITCTLSARVPVDIDRADNIEWRKTMWIDIEPYLDEGGSALLRQLESRRKRARRFDGENDFVAVIGEYRGQGASLQQLRQIFDASHFKAVLLEDFVPKLHQLGTPPSSAQGSLPLLQAAQ